LVFRATGVSPWVSTSRSWKDSDFRDRLFRYIEISSVTKDKGIIGYKTMHVKDAPSRATTLVKKDDIILSTTRPYLGAFAIVSEEYDNCVCSSGFALADSITIDGIDKNYLLSFLKSPVGLRQMERRMTGGLYPAIIQSELEKIKVPLPSQEVQQKNVKQQKDIQSEIVKQQARINQIRMNIKEEIEEMILGIRPVPGTAELTH